MLLKLLNVDPPGGPQLGTPALYVHIKVKQISFICTENIFPVRLDICFSPDICFSHRN